MKVPNLTTLAKRLSVHTVQFRDQVIAKALENGIEESEIHIESLCKNVQWGIFSHLDKKEFAHQYALTLSSLFLTASFLSSDKEGRKNLKQCLSELMNVFSKAAVGQNGKTAQIISKIIKSIEKINFPVQLKKCVLEVIDAIEHAGVERQAEDEFYRLLGFYEAFLEEYAPRLKKEAGIFFTPYSVVSFIVRTLHSILKKQLNRPGGLANQSTIIIDPATGTSTFLLTAVRLAMDEYSMQNGDKDIQAFASYYLLNNLYGYEKLLPLFAVSYLNFAYFIKRGDLQLQEDLLNLFLANTFDKGCMDLNSVASAPASPVMVILGNPPYSRNRGNDEPWIIEKIKDYFMIQCKNGGKIWEKNLKWLHNDYVKFIRFAQDKIDRTGEGVMGFITNNAFLNSPTFRAMRQSLINSFDEIYILNLHGNVMQNETCPDGSRDENIFPIRQGVAITFFVKRKDGDSTCNVFYSDLLGTSEYKLEYLKVKDMESICWQQVFPKPDFYMLTPSAGERKSGPGPEGYKACFKVTDIFNVHGVGIVTARDGITIQKTRKEMEQIVDDFDKLDEKELRSKYKIREDTRDWKVSLAQADIRESGPDKKKIHTIHYRPFDIRFTYFTGRSRGFLCMPRNEVMRHMLRANTALVTVRQVAEGNFNHCFLASTLVDGRVTKSNRGICHVFPLYFYPDSSDKRWPNISGEVREWLRKHMGMNDYPDACDVFNYIYALLNSTLYRTDFASHLEIDFPLIPFTSSEKLFKRLAQLGSKLQFEYDTISLHVTSFPFYLENGNSYTVKNVRYVSQDSGSGRVYVNAKNYFANVPQEVWEYLVCGYKVLYSLLKSYKGRPLTLVDNLHTIVRLPKGVFNPYTSIKTNLLFFTKGRPTKEIWYYEHPYPAGYKSYSKTKPMTIEEFVPEKKWWNDRVENRFAWRVPISDIKNRNYNLDIKNPNTGLNSPHEDLADLETLAAEIANLDAEAHQIRIEILNELMTP